jgi:hypothetical protein
MNSMTSGTALLTANGRFVSWRVNAGNNDPMKREIEESKSQV